MAERRLIAVTLDEGSVPRRSADLEHERRVAIYDLIEQNEFSPRGDHGGPYHLHLAITEGRLVFDIRDQDDTPLGKVILALSPLRAVIKDYMAVCSVYYEAIKNASPARIESIDMGRRGLHNQGSELLVERLKGKIDIDRDTARRLFTLICVLLTRD
ncbi:UPF0262 family protein [Zavarzinia sp. CC-PAN008]|uniref:UPF0262 family protein n=1 Tax=Zavarzinia sp. CC-PAN008 TaxID=3243332 RepID=UPI003F7424E9